MIPTSDGTTIEDGARQQNIKRESLATNVLTSHFGVVPSLTVVPMRPSSASLVRTYINQLRVHFSVRNLPAEHDRVLASEREKDVGVSL